MSNSFDFTLFSANPQKQQADQEEKLPTELDCQVKFNFLDKQIVFCFSDDKWDWKPYAVDVKYKSIDGDVSLNDRIENFDRFSFDGDLGLGYEKFSQMYELKIDGIIRMVLYKRFSVTIGYLFIDDPDKFYATEYEFNVSAAIFVYDFMRAEWKFIFY